MRLSADRPRAPVPPLPGSDSLLESTRTYWQTLWRSPMAAAWLEADVPALARLTMLVDMASSGDASARVLAEIRQLEDRFGLSPLARRRLQWELYQAGGGGSRHSLRTPTGDDERWLRLVSDCRPQTPLN